METEYEKLKKEGYTEEEIDAKLGPMSRLSIDSSPMGQGRDDRSVTFTDKDGTVSRSSNIMMGYNRRNIQLPNGTYVGVEEFSRAMTEYLQENAGNKVIFCRRTGKRVNVDELIDGLREVAQSQAGLEVHGTTDKMHGNAYEYSIKGDTARRVLLGKKVQLECGQWVSEEELLNAMRDYVYLSAPVKTPSNPTPVPVPGQGKNGNEPHPGSDGNEKEPSPGSEQEPVFVPGPGENGNEPYPGLEPVPVFIPGPGEKKPEPDNIIGVDEHGIEGVTPGTKEIKHVEERDGKKRKFNILPLIVAIGLTLTMLASMIGTKFSGKTVDKPIPVATTKFTQMVKAEEGEEKTDGYINTDPGLYGKNVGDKTTTKENQKYFKDANNTLHIGSAFGQNPERPAGDYKIYGIAVIGKNDKKILDTEFKEGTPIADVISRACEENNVGIDQVELGVSIDATGWLPLFDVAPLIKAYAANGEITIDDAVKACRPEKTYDAVQEDFTDSVTFQTEDGEVTLKVKNDDGSIVEPGKLIEGTDGKLYRLDTIELSEKDSGATQLEESKKTVFSVSNIPENVPILVAGGGLTSLASVLYFLSTNKKSEREYEIQAAAYNDNNKFDKTMNLMGTIHDRVNNDYKNNDTPDYEGPIR